MAKILLVEDDTNLSEIYQARMEAEGYTVVSAADGESALSLAAKEKPDLILSDVMMPKISGFEMLDILRNTDGLKHTKVIMLTALGQAEDQARAQSLGADKYLVKSQVTLEDIVSAAQELLNEDNQLPTPAQMAAATVTAASDATSSDTPQDTAQPDEQADSPADATAGPAQPAPTGPLTPTTPAATVATTDTVADIPVVAAPDDQSDAQTDDQAVTEAQPAAEAAPEPAEAPATAPTEPAAEPEPVAEPEPAAEAAPELPATTEVAPLTEVYHDEPASAEPDTEAAPAPPAASPEPVAAPEPAAEPVAEAPEVTDSTPAPVPTPALETPAKPESTEQPAPAAEPEPKDPAPAATPVTAAAIDEKVVSNAIDKLLAKSPEATKAAISPGSGNEHPRNKVIAPIPHPPEPTLQELLAKEEAKNIGSVAAPTVTTASGQPGAIPAPAGSGDSLSDEAQAAALLAKARAAGGAKDAQSAENAENKFDPNSISL